MIKNIIFDLGGVVLNIDYDKTSAEFQKLGVKNFDELYSQAKQNSLFDKLEKGLISEEDFRDSIRRLAGFYISDQDIDRAWNAMLLDLPAARIEILKNAALHYRTFLLSNTNSIHLRDYTMNLKKEHGIDSLSQLFEREFFSHEIHLRKPDVEAFKHVIDITGVIPADTLFIDDSPQHLRGARKTGLKTLFMDTAAGMTLSSVFENGFLKKEYLP